MSELDEKFVVDDGGSSVKPSEVHEPVAPAGGTHQKKKADVNYIRRINSSFYIPLLMQAVMDNSTQIATYLISKGADVNSKDGFKMTCLMWSANNGNIELTKLLLENGADKNAEDANGMTALKAAQSKGHKEIAELLNKN